jgi:hypothetical protein
MKRYKHNLSHNHLTTFNMGTLVPVSTVEVLPGDSFRGDTSALLRLSPQVKPVMHPTTCYIRHFFVPNRILWSGWEDFITGVSATPPPVIAGTAHNPGSLTDYMGIYGNGNNDVNALPIRAYNMIYNEYFRDKDLQTEAALGENSVKKVCWGKDLFTTARPSPQQGDTVTIPVGELGDASLEGIGFQSDIGQTGTNGNSYEPGDTAATVYSSYKDDLLRTRINPSTGHPDISVDFSGVSGIDVRDFREAMALQNYAEARARYGESYVDYLRYLGVRPSDARLQRPEYLGGGRQAIHFTDVVNQSGTGTAGDLAGHAISAFRTNKFRFFAEEHGWLITLMYVRPKAIYAQAHPRRFFRSTKEEYFQRELQNIGMQEVLNKEVYASHTDPEGVFGWSARYDEYRSMSDHVSANFRNTLEYDWHFARIFESSPALNSTFVKCEVTKRPFADQTAHCCLANVHNKLIVRRQVGGRAVKGAW